MNLCHLGPDKTLMLGWMSIWNGSVKSLLEMLLARRRALHLGVRRPRVTRFSLHPLNVTCVFLVLYFAVVMLTDGRNCRDVDISSVLSIGSRMIMLARPRRRPMLYRSLRLLLLFLLEKGRLKRLNPE